MNKRIRELAEEAQVDGDSIHYYSPAFVEKFAELIVKECIQMADEFEVDVNRSGLVDRIKQHFGVYTDDEVEYCPRCNAQWSGTSCGLPNCGWVVEVNE